MTRISASVGTGGINRRSDVIVVQNLVNDNLGSIVPLATLQVDGRSGPATVGAIEEFQRRMSAWRIRTVASTRAAGR